jgi:A/G-specific adenine glycosylase
MAQQTQLDRVKAYWGAWMERWPDVASLAAATDDDVRAAWAGLGYYRRAAFLLKGARYVVEELNGVFPTDVAGLLKIPGVGAYTSAAMASIAAGAHAAVVDGNVVRVLSRLRALAGDPKSGAAGKAHARLAARLLDPGRPGDFNQAVMELGATVCTPSGAPACASCPVASLCHARARAAAGAGSATDFPTPAAKPAKREERVAVCVVEAVDGGARRVLLQRRPEGGLLAGLWEFPSVPVAADAGANVARAAVDAHVELLLGEALPEGKTSKGESGETRAPAPSSLRLLRRASVGDIVHIFSHIRMTLAVEHARVDAGGGGLSADPRDADAVTGRPATRWVDVDSMADEKVSSSVAKCWRLVASGGGGVATAAKRAAAPAAAAAGQGSIKKFFSAKKE